VRTSVLTSALTVAVVIVATLFYATAPASGAGSIISSFRLSGYSDPYANGLYVGSTFVSVIYCTAGGDYLYRYRPNGSLIRSYNLNGTSTPQGGDNAHLGAGYISLVDSDTSRVYIYRALGGNPVASFAATGPGGGSLQDVMWTGSYYEVADHLGNGRFNRYSTAGSLLGSVAYDGWPTTMTTTGAVAYSDIAEGRSGSYLVASPRTNGQPSCIIDLAAGSLVATFDMPPYFASGSCCGKSSKSAQFGNSYWATWIMSNAIWCYEVDIGGKAGSAVTPASIGKIKAIYQ